MPKILTMAFHLDDEGFNQKYHAKDSLTSLMGLPTGSMVSRTEAQRAICYYIKNNNLAIHGKITPNIELTALLEYEVSMGPLKYPTVIMLMQNLFPHGAEVWRRRDAA